MLDYQKQNEWMPDKNYLQSPINIEEDKVKLVKQSYTFVIVEPLKVDEIKNMGNTLKYFGTGKVMISGMPYDFVQAHFHHPSEHQINGKATAFEIHFVFKNNIGQLIVMAMLINLGAKNQLIKQMIEQKPFSPDLHLNNEIKGYHYLGSLTTPPLSPGVEWLVLNSHKMTISQTQLDWFKQHFPTSARDIQDLQKRVVERFE